MKISILNILISLLFLTACNNNITNEKIQLRGSDILLDLSIEEIEEEVNEYAFELPAEPYRAKKFKGAYNLSIKCKIKNTSNQELIFCHYDYSDNNLFLISGPISIEKLIHNDVDEGSESVDEMRENGKFKEGLGLSEMLEEHRLENDESYIFDVNFNTIDSNLQELYFGGFFTKPETSNICRLFFKIEQEKSFTGKIKYKVVGKRFEKIGKTLYPVVDTIN